LRELELHNRFSAMRKRLSPGEKRTKKRERVFAAKWGGRGKKLCDKGGVIYCNE